MEKIGSFDYTKQTMRRLVAQILETVYSLDRGQGRGKGTEELLSKTARI